MNIAIIQFPGSNCERETILAVKRAGMNPVEFLWNEPASLLSEMDGYIIVGGFSYEDRSRAGIIAALDPIMKEIKRQSELGKPILGICNGAQILVETGLVPGLKNNQIGMALTENKRMLDGKILGTGFYNEWISMRTHPQLRDNAFTRHLTPESLLNIPIAHAQGRFVMPLALLNEIQQQGLNAFQYCDAQGEVIDNFPVNPNGSMANIAAIINHSGNVMAMMPHPERTPAGDAIFSSMKEYLQERSDFNPSHLEYTPQPISITKYQKKSGSQQLLVQLIITDNQAVTVQNTLNQLGLSVKVRLFTHWEIESNQPDILQQLIKTGILFNERKERLVSEQLLHTGNCYLVRAKYDMVGQQKMQMLTDHFSLPEVTNIQHGIVWHFEQAEENSALIQSVLNTHIIFNPYAHDCYEYQ